MSDEQAGQWVVEEYGPRWRNPDGSGATLPNFERLSGPDAAEAKAALVALIHRDEASTPGTIIGGDFDRADGVVVHVLMPPDFVLSRRGVALFDPAPPAPLEEG